MTRQGEMDLDPARWPDPAAMNKQLHSMGVTTLLSVWPHYAPGTQFYDMLKQKGWLINNPTVLPIPGDTPPTSSDPISIPPTLKLRNGGGRKIRDRYINRMALITSGSTKPNLTSIPITILLRRPGKRTTTSIRCSIPLRFTTVSGAISATAIA